MREVRAIALSRLGRMREAAAEFDRVAALRIASLGANHTDTERARNWHAATLREAAVSEEQAASCGSSDNDGGAAG